MAITINLLSETDVNRIYSVTIDNTRTVVTTVTTSYSVADAWVNHILADFHQSYINRNLIIGVSVEYSPFNHHFVCTLQLSTASHCLILQLCQCNPPFGFAPFNLRRFLVDQRITFVCLNPNLNIDLRITPHRLGFVGRMPVNLRLHVRGGNGENIEDYSIPRIAREILGTPIQETVMESAGLSYYSGSWEARHLSLDQVTHATLEACVPCWIGLQLRGEF